MTGHRTPVGAEGDEGEGADVMPGLTGHPHTAPSPSVGPRVTGPPGGAGGVAWAVGGDAPAVKP